MSEENQLVVAPEPPKREPIQLSENGLQLRTLDDMARFCLAVSKSRLAPKGFETPEAIMVAIMHGQEIGLSPMQALQSICVINGRPSIWGDAALAIVKARPDCEDVIETTDGTTAKCEVRRRGKATVIRTFSDADAKLAGLIGKSGPWSQYPARMRQLRARGFALRDSFPDALRGIGIAEEVRDIPAIDTKRVTLTLPDGSTDAAE